MLRAVHLAPVLALVGCANPDGGQPADGPADGGARDSGNDAARDGSLCGALGQTCCPAPLPSCEPTLVCSSSGLCNCVPGTPGWTTRAPYPIAVARAGLAGTVGGTFYISGDRNGTTATYAYDPAANAWTQVANAPLGRTAGASAVLDGKIFAFTDVTQVYEPSSNTWAVKTAPPASVAWGAAAAARGRVYAFHASSNYEYDPGADVWAEKASPPINHGAYPVVATVNDIVYVIGGAVPYSAQNDAYDPATNTWTTRAAIPAPATYKGYAASAVFNGNIYVMGGGNWDSATNEFWSYAVATDTWTRKEAVPNSLNVSSAAMLGSGALFLVGGERPGVYGSTGNYFYNVCSP